MGLLTDWGAKVVVETFTAATKRYEGRTVADVAAEEGKAPFDALLDIVVADDLRTSFRNASDDDTDGEWAARAELWRDPRRRRGVGCRSPPRHAGDRQLQHRPPRPRRARAGLLSTEEAVRLLTSVPADLYGLRGRGRLAEGAAADVVVFDEATVGPEDVSTRFDLPSGAGRLYAGAHGVDHVLVNGVPIVTGGELTGDAPGTLLRSGRDTATPSLV